MARYWLPSETRHVVQPTVMDVKNMGNDGKKPFWGKDSRGFWLVVCLGISALAGWLMFRAGVIT
ncbi:MAG: hypothetical protein J0I96_00290 [Rhodanobacter sp.]|uniref:hypothetical protein n=1 Tax=Rhodanobacter sp. PCA2 TaxID=2006117 RepID=UPI0015E725C5|nr:hypothetical protein [Rhodanobacter sp. PCA2]MBN8921509.1 hypothetical protein [Rhodanobacter sp.]